MNSSNDTMTASGTDSHHKVYERAEIYDFALADKDFSQECSFLTSCFEDIRRRPPASWLEVAAGPARHTLEMARRGLRCTALDLSPEMVRFGRQLGEHEGFPFTYMCGDMSDFRLDEPVDLAGIFLDSITVMLDNDVLDRHLSCMADALADDGLYILELSHPSDYFGTRTAVSEWETARDGKTVYVKWGHDDDPFDPVTQITQESVYITVTENGRTTEIRDTSRSRIYTATEFEALVQSNGRFETVARYGAMDENIDLHHPKAWRNVVVLQKR